MQSCQKSSFRGRAPFWYRPDQRTVTQQLQKRNFHYSWQVHSRTTLAQERWPTKHACVVTWGTITDTSVWGTGPGKAVEVRDMCSCANHFQITLMVKELQERDDHDMIQDREETKIGNPDNRETHCGQQVLGYHQGVCQSVGTCRHGLVLRWRHTGG